jgi:aminomuconate-semialdehyde/2-hydroxymuconate-6-semialdehyde dehydrogenase
VRGPCAQRDEDEVIKLANDTKYGLAATFFSTNSSRVHRVAPQLEAGIVWVNSWFLRDLRTAFGGMKHSGSTARVVCTGSSSTPRCPTSV